MDNRFDVIIIGAGPAGMTAAIYASRAELKTLILESGMPGGKVALTSDVENWPGYAKISGAELAEQFFAHCQAFGADYRTQAVTGLRDHGAWKEVLCDEDSYFAKAVILASGTVERKLGIPGEKEYYGLGLSYCAVCDGAFFRDREVAVIGGGNSAFEDALYLTRYASHVTVLTRRDVARADKTNQRRLAENPKITWIKKVKPLEVLGTDGMVSGLRLASAEDGSESVLNCEGVFPMVGLDANTGFIDFPGLKDDEGFILAKPDMSTAVPGIFSAGDVNAKPLRQIVTATGDAAIAAQSAAHYVELWSE